MDTLLHRVIGIDLGTTYCAVSAFSRDTEEAVIIATEAGEETVPSVVSLIGDPQRVIVGREAKANLFVFPEQTIVEIKREMGETFSQATLAQYRERAEQQGVQPRPYSPDGPKGSGQEGDPFVTLLGGEHYMPQEISAFILMKMASVAKALMGEEIKEIVDAVITVPAYFTERQRSATREAALLAGLYPRQLIPERGSLPAPTHPGAHGRGDLLRTRPLRSRPEGLSRLRPRRRHLRRVHHHGKGIRRQRRVHGRQRPPGRQ